MPIYEYQCEKCGVFEVTQRITENSLKRCPTCKGKVERIMSATSFVLKGSGWYATDYARAGSAKTDSKTESSSDGSSTSGGTSASPSGDNGSAAATKTATESPKAGGSDKSGSDKTAAKSSD